VIYTNYSSTAKLNQTVPVLGFNAEPIDLAAHHGHGRGLDPNGDLVKAAGRI
jgi:hypothetical protein